MRFRFCGDLDCPDWILAEINTIARMTSIKMKLLCQEVVKQMLDESLDYDRVKKLTSDARFELGDVKATVAAITFIMTSSAQHGVDEEALNSELQQLGLPREHSVALCRVYSEKLALLTQVLCATSLRLSGLNLVDCRVNLLGGSSVHPFDNMKLMPEFELRLAAMDLIHELDMLHIFVLTKEQLATLIAGLKKAQEIMESL